jgi:hypothetical protein
MALIVLAAVAILIQVGPKLIGRWTAIGNSLDGATGPSVVVTDAQKSTSTTLP